MKEKIICKICGKGFSKKGLGYHLSLSHKILPKEYYDIYLKQEDNEGICQLKGCNNKTNFYNCIKGYAKYCSHDHTIKSYKEKDKRKMFREKMEKTNLERYGVKNYNDIEKMKKTNLKKFGKEIFFQTKQFREKSNKTKKEKYGNKNYTNREKAFKTCIKKYGYYTHIYTKNHRKIMEEKYHWTSLSQKTDFELYKMKVNGETKKWKKELFKEWDGYDYYDEEYIKENFKLHHLNKKYPTIDHKVSVLYGFKNNIDPKTIGNIDNLCITKRSINSSKQHLTEEQYLNSI